MSEYEDGSKVSLSLSLSLNTRLEASTLELELELKHPIEASRLKLEKMNLRFASIYLNGRYLGGSE